MINNDTNNLNNPNHNYDATITADITTESNFNTQGQLESTHDITYAPHAHTPCQTINNLYLTGSDTSYTGFGANRIESFVGQEVEQGLYPQEAATSVTPANHNQVNRYLGLGTEVLRSSRRNYQQARGNMLTLMTCSSMRERHKQPIVHGNGKSALRQRSNVTTDHNTRRVRRRRQRYRHRGRRTRSAQSSTNHIGQS